MATSASRSRVVASTPCSGYSAMPMLMPILSRCIPTIKSCSIAFTSFWATVAAKPGNEFFSEFRHCLLIKAHENVGMPQHPSHAGAHLLQQLIADIMAEGVINLLETIEAHHEQGESRLGAAGGYRPLTQLLMEIHAVRQVRQRVGKRCMLKRLMHASKFRAEGVEILRQLVELGIPARRQLLAQARRVFPDKTQVLLQHREGAQRRAVQHYQCRRHNRKDNQGRKSRHGVTDVGEFPVELVDILQYRHRQDRLRT